MASPEQFSFVVGNMSCGSCAARVQKALQKLPDIEDVHVNFANNSAHVTTRHIDGALIEETLQKAGYPAETETARFEIDGMHCGSCVGRVEKSIAAVAGVTSVSVNLATSQAFVQFLKGATSPKKIGLAVSSSGYQATQISDTAAPKSNADKREDDVSDLRNHTSIAALFTVPLFLIEMGGHILPAFHHWIASTIGTQKSWMLQFVLCTLVLMWPGRDFYRSGIPALLHGRPDMNSLVALGTLAAWGFSTLSVFAPSILPIGAAAVYFEAAAVIVTLILLGRLLEARAKGQTGAAIERLMGLRAQSATVQRGQEWINIPIEDVQTGDLVLVKAGQVCAADGNVEVGESYIDESMVTGEPIPVFKKIGDTVTGGTINGNSVLQVRATTVGSDSLLSQIIGLVQNAQGAKLPIQGLVNKITLWIVPAVLVLALITVCLWIIFGPSPTIGNALVAGVAVLIIACPCAMGLATPTSIMVGTGRAADSGVLFRQSDALQRLQSVKLVAFDKTGTLTQGAPSVTDFEYTGPSDRAQIMNILAALEEQSDHPLAKAIVDFCLDGPESPLKVWDVRADLGAGMSGMVDGHQVYIGNKDFIAKLGKISDVFERAATDWAREGKTPVFFWAGDLGQGCLGITDPLKPSAKATISSLQNAGVSVAMITGDREETATVIAKKLGISIVQAQVLPAQKAQEIAALQKAHGPVAFVGDGINDAPALAQSDVGMAIGSGTDVAIEAADVILMSGDPESVNSAIAISKATLNNIKQNLFWAFGYNVLLIPVAAGALYPIWGVLLSPALAAGAMALSSVFVVTNALRLRKMPLTSSA